MGNSENNPQHQLEGTWLILDASCPQTQVALFKDGTLQDLKILKAPAMESLLNCVRTITTQHHTSIRDINGFIYCTGPGSILGIRLSIMAIKTWCTLYNVPQAMVKTYNSLSMAAAQCAANDEIQTEHDFIICSEWKKGFWNTLFVKQGQLNSTIEIWSSEQLEAFEGPKRLLSQRKIWTNAIPNLPHVEYNLRLLESPCLQTQLLHPLENWEVYTPDKKQYATWSGERHRA